MNILILLKKPNLYLHEQSKASKVSYYSKSTIKAKTSSFLLNRLLQLTLTKFGISYKATS
jgi:hypothetical protein